MLIGIHGPLDGGKDTVATKLQLLRPEFTRYAFAKPLKEALKLMFGFTDAQLEDRRLKEQVDPFWGFSPRRAMQLLGTEYGRNMLREDIWIKRAEFEVANNAERGLSTIITDVRFENEAEWIRSRDDAILIVLEVPGLVRDERYQHASEAGITRSATDIVLVNDKTQGLRALDAKIKDIVTKLFPV
jgi:hypothetical protein